MGADMAAAPSLPNNHSGVVSRAAAIFSIVSYRGLLVVPSRIFRKVSFAPVASIETRWTLLFNAFKRSWMRSFNMLLMMRII
ncbi:hypothetical protein SAMN05892877_12187 [Rhizobium subbaraonis]|uniref:Uncharacterized protein n=1 Tax=Rhizobium subbaraonis TaxID=908946 RepID=A0A285UY33_9HYPH|nr:hypothetical protein SAMN05892877_12187 [Rhizobium subbaraonis]